MSDACFDRRARDRAIVVQKKAGIPVQFELTEQTHASVEGWPDQRQPKTSPYFVPSRFKSRPHISARQYARILRRSVASALD